MDFKKLYKTLRNEGLSHAIAFNIVGIILASLPEKRSKPTAAKKRYKKRGA